MLTSRIMIPPACRADGKRRSCFGKYAHACNNHALAGFGNASEDKYWRIRRPMMAIILIVEIDEGMMLGRRWPHWHGRKLIYLSEAYHALLISAMLM